MARKTVQGTMIEALTAFTTAVQAVTALLSKRGDDKPEIDLATWNPTIKVTRSFSLKFFVAPYTSRDVYASLSMDCPADKAAEIGDSLSQQYQPAESSHWRSVEERDLIAAGFRTTDAAGCWRLDAGRISVVAVLGGPWKVALPGLGGQLLVVPQPQNAAWFWAMVYQLSDAAGPLSVPRPSNPDPDDHNATHR